MSPKSKRSIFQRSDMTTNVVALPTCDEIAARAHELFVEDGSRVSRFPAHWERAEQELLDRAFNRLSTSIPVNETRR